MFGCVVPGLEGSALGTPLPPPHWEREMRQLSMVMLVNHGAKERDEGRV
jgi:hypothetical protein